MADKKGGKKDEGGVDDIMAPGEMKPILAKAKRGDPVSCAIAMTKDKEGAILLDKRKKPKKLLTELRKQAGDAGLELETTSLRFGHASVPDDDAAMVVFTLNKEASGAMRPRLLERLKKAGFTKLELTVDATLEAEPEEDEDQAAPAVAGAGDDDAQVAAAPAAVAPDADSAGSAAPGADSAGAASPGQAVPGQDGQNSGAIAAMTKALGGLVKQVQAAMTAVPDQRGALIKLVQDAKTALDSKEEQAANAAIEAIKQALDAASQMGAGAGSAAGKSGKGISDGAKKLVDTSKVAWTAAVKKIGGDIDKLLGELSKVYKDHGIADDLEKIFRSKVDPMMASFDEDLTEKLEELGNCADPAEVAKLVAEARQILKRYQASLASEPLIAKLDSNPVMPVAVGKTMQITLSTLDKTLASVAAQQERLAA